MLLSSQDRARIIDIARQTLPPPVEIWAHGSRVNGSAHDTSDLDLVVRGENLAAVSTGDLAAFITALEQSTIPLLIQVVDWAKIPDSFRANILQCHEVLTVIDAD